MSSPGTRPELLRSLGAWQAAAIVVGTIIGTGVFLKAAPMAQLAGSAGWVLAAWAVGGDIEALGGVVPVAIGLIAVFTACPWRPARCATRAATSRARS